jgi:hypothetical protein
MGTSVSPCLTVYLLDKGIDRIHAGAAEVGRCRLTLSNSS